MPVRKDISANTVMNAIAYMIKESFTEEDWFHLGIETDELPVIRDHDRLLRSLSFGDSDYLPCIMDVLPAVLGQVKLPRSLARNATVVTLPNFAIVERHLDLETWLKRNKPELHRRLYGASDTDYLDDLIDAAPDPVTLADIEEHVQRIRAGLHNDPVQAIGSAKELLETVLKSILGLHGTGPETKLELPKLAGKTMDHLGLNPATIESTEPGAVQRKRLLGSVSTIVTAIAELRNAGLGTGHGVSRRPQLNRATARLAVASAVSAATFFIEAAEEQESVQE
ncbi:abortive infection family protein [Rhodococcus opacus]|uniref:abortive infection family protein n=1 Tax=Rhodococcus opacus TaxID=37919 RepID=UPI00294A10C3|nr:abortive infection family protein [Rhodococcus opacus]MDV6247237.1 abortive infection family protein [Rhodococcus opacus]